MPSLLQIFHIFAVDVQNLMSFLLDIEKMMAQILTRFTFSVKINEVLGGTVAVHPVQFPGNANAQKK